MYVAESIEKFLHHCEIEKNLASHTLSAYSLDLGHLREFLSIHSVCILPMVSTSHIKQYVRIFAKATIRSRRFGVNSLYCGHSFDLLKKIIGLNSNQPSGAILH